MRNSNGFTLAEVLIVTAIIGILTAVSVPLFLTELEKSRERTDTANMEAALVASSALYLDSMYARQDQVRYYNAKSGGLETDPENIVPYGQGTEKNGGTEDFEMYQRTIDTRTKTSCTDPSHGREKYSSSSEASGKILRVTVFKDGCISMTWI